MENDKTPAPQRAGTRDDEVMQKLATELAALKRANPVGYQGLVQFARSLVEKNSTKGLTRIAE